MVDDWIYRARALFDNNYYFLEDLFNSILLYF